MVKVFSFPLESNLNMDMNCSIFSVGGFWEINTPNEIYLERSQLGVEQFLAMLRFEIRSKFEELTMPLR